MSQGPDGNLHTVLVSSSVQRPAVQPSQGPPSHALSQQAPETQCPEAHEAGSEQLSPFASRG
jgi:hypothetical protein